MLTVWVSYGVHMVHAYMTEIKEYDCYKLKSLVLDRKRNLI